MNTKITSLEPALIGAFAFFVVCGIAKSARAAEGPFTRIPPGPAGGGEWGVNRRVTSDPDCVGANGTFVMDFGLPQDAAGHVTVATNPKNDSPSFYLGGSGLVADPATWGKPRVEVDAGLQWEWQNTPTRPRGWIAFISVDGHHTNPAVYDANIHDYTPWRAIQRTGADQSYILRGTGKKYDLKYRVNSDGTIQLDVEGLGVFYWSSATHPSTSSQSGVWPNVGTSVMAPANLDSQRVKKVIAMTRDRPYTDVPDGSWAKCVFRNGEVVHSNGQKDDWTERWVNATPNASLSPTGYDAPGNSANGGGGANSIDAKRNGGRSPRSRYIVDFPSLNGATPVAKTELITAGRSSGSTSETELSESRYHNETVRINLRTYQSLSGQRVHLGP